MIPIAPRFSIVTPVYNPDPAVLRDTVASVLAQTCDDWEWVVVDDASPDPAVRAILAAAAAGDHRIRHLQRAENGHIVAASNDAVDAATGEFLVLLDHDDLLTPNALEEVARHLGPAVDYLYSDEDKVDETGRHFDHFRKPAWSPERLLAQMYTGHLSVLRTSLVREVGRFRPGYEGSQDHDLVLRVTERAGEIVHIPTVLYHWRLVSGSAAGDPHAKPYAYAAGRRAVQDALNRRGVEGTVEFLPEAPGCYRVRRHLPPERTVSLVVPTRGQEGIVWGERRCFVVEAVRSALAATAHPSVEVVVVFDEGETPEPVLAALREVCGDRLVLVPYARAFNFSEKCNVGFLASSGEFVVLLNDDVQARVEGWLEQLVAPLLDPSVGMTGAKLFFADTTLQHAGHAYSRGHFHHPYAGIRGSHPGYMSGLLVNREVSGVTAAAAALRRSVLDEVGGLCEELPRNFNDVDLSRKVRNAGYRVLVVATSELYHFESRTRERHVEEWERPFIVERWGPPLHDPYLPDM